MAYGDRRKRQMRKDINYFQNIGQQERTEKSNWGS
jgi:hypothetical protein